MTGNSLADAADIHPNLDSELEICLELPTSSLTSYDSVVSLPSSHYEEEGMYYLLALTTLRKLMVEVVYSVSTKGSCPKHTRV